MLDKQMLDRLNKHINAELYSSYLYLSMSAYFSDAGLPGCAHWMMLQSKEENVHAMKMYDYVNDHGGRIILQAIAEPPAQFESYEDVFKQVYEHEQHVTHEINDLVELATKIKDHATFTFLQWFVTEQVEEEAMASEILDRLKLVGGSGPALMMLDRELASRSQAE